MVRALWVCALVCLFALTARAAVDIPWPPTALPDCSAPWASYGEAYEFCHMTLTGTQTSNLLDSETVSAEIYPCNWHFFRLDAASYPNGLQVGDWLELTLSLDNTLGNVNVSSVSLLYRFSDSGVLPSVDDLLPAQIAIDDLPVLSSQTFVVSPCPLSANAVLWLAVGDFTNNYAITSDPGSYSLTVDRFRTDRDCGDCICDATLGLTEIPLTAASLPVLLSGSTGWIYDDSRPGFDESASSLYPRYRNFHFNVPAASYAPGAFLFVNVTSYNASSTGGIEVFLSEGPFAVDSNATECYYDSVAPSGEVCPDGTTIGAGNSGIYVPPCDLYYGDYYLTVVFASDNCTSDADYLITVTVMAPQVTSLAIAASPSVVGPVANNLQTNVLFGHHAGYSQFDHYQLTVAGITERTHAFAWLSSVVEVSSYNGYSGSIWDLRLAMRAATAGPAPSFGSRDRVLVPLVPFPDRQSCGDDCYATDYQCSTDGQCGCGFYVRSCDLDATTYYLSVAPESSQTAASPTRGPTSYIVDGQSYHLLVRVDEDSLPATLAPGQPVVAVLPVWSPYQVYVLAAPNSANTWAVIELFTPTTQNPLVLDLKQGSSLTAPTTYTTECSTATTTTSTSSFLSTVLGRSFEEKCNKRVAKSFVAPGTDAISCDAAEADQSCSTGSEYACYLTVDTCKMQNGLIYLAVYPQESVDPTHFYGSWDYTIWADIESPWAVESDVTYTDRVRFGQYNHYYIDVDEDAAQPGSWLSVDFENVEAACPTGFLFATFLNYDAPAGYCPCYQATDSCVLTNARFGIPTGCPTEECPPGLDWEWSNGFNIADNTYPFYYNGDLISDTNGRGACRVQATACAFRPGRWYASVTLQPLAETIAREPVPLFGTSSNGGAIAGYTMTARIHAAPEVAELTFDELHTDVLQPSQIQHFQLTNVDASGEDLVLTVSWYEEALARYNLFTGSNYQEYAAQTLPKAWVAGWGIELRVSFGDLALEECYDHPWSCTASIATAASCQVIVPACRFAAVDPDQVFVSVRYSRPINGPSDDDNDEFVNSEFSNVPIGVSSGYSFRPLPDSLLPELWVGEAQYNLLVTSEATTVVGLPINTAVYGAVHKDRYAHYSFNLASTSLLRTDIDIYYHYQSTMDGAEPVLALSANNLAFGARGCRDCFTSVRSCQSASGCHWSYDSCDGLSAGSTYYLSVYNPPVAFFDQALEYALQVGQQPLLNTVTLGTAGRVQLDVALQADEPTRVFFQVEFDTAAVVSPWDGLYVFVYLNGDFGGEERDISRSAPTYYWQHDELAGRCDCFSFRCADELNTNNNCPIDSSDRTIIFDQDLSAGAYFLTVEFPSGRTDSVQLTVQAELISYTVNRRTPTANRGSGSVFTLGNSLLDYGEDITLDYNDGDNMDNWLTTTGGAIDWDETNNVLRNQQATSVYYAYSYGFPESTRYAPISQGAIFYYLTVTNPSAVDGYPMPDRVFAGIDNVRTNYDNCGETPDLRLFYFGTQAQALSTLDSYTNGVRTCSDSDSSYYSSVRLMTTSNGVAFGELPACIFTHAGTTEYFFFIDIARETFFEVELADGSAANPVVPTLLWDVRFFLQQPIAMQSIDAFYVGPSYVTETVGYPYTTNWQPFVGDQVWSNDEAFLQRFRLDLGQLTGTDNFAQVVIEIFEETPFDLSVAINGQYAPNRPVNSGACFGGCHLRSRLEQRQGSLSALQLNAVASNSRLGNASDAALNFADPDSDLVYTCSYPSCVFTLDPCALSQTSLWFFDIWSEAANVSFAVYYTPVVDLAVASVTEITAQDINDRDYVPDLATLPAQLSGLDDYEFFFIDLADLNLNLAQVRSRLEIQVFWEQDFNVDQDPAQTAAIFVSKEQPLFLQAGGNLVDFPFQFDWLSNTPYNYAVRGDYNPNATQFQEQQRESFIEQCFTGHYASIYQGNLSNVLPSSATDGRFVLDGCDLQGVSQLWITARMMTEGTKEFRLLTRVVRDKVISNLPIRTGYSSASPSYSVDSDDTTAIEPRSANHHSFALPADLQSGAARSVNFELRFDDAQTYRYDNGSAQFVVLVSADSPAGWNPSFGPYMLNLPLVSASTPNAGLLSFGEITSSADFPSAVTADCFSNLAAYSTVNSSVQFSEVGLIPVSGWSEFYYARGTVDLYNLRFASQLWLSVYFVADFDAEPLNGALQTEQWQGYTLTVWTQAEPSTTVTPILQNISANDVCHTLSVDTGIDALTIDNITWANSEARPPTPTWFTFTLDDSLVPLDCSNLETDSRCMFTQYLRFQLFNDDFFTPLSTTGGAVLGYEPRYLVYGPGRISIGGAGDMFSNSAANDAFGGRWAIHDSHLNSAFYPHDVVANASSTAAYEFYPCSGRFGPDSDWIPDNLYNFATSTSNLRPGTYYLPVWTFDSIDFTVCASLEQIPYDTLWTDPVTPYVPAELIDDTVSVLAQDEVTVDATDGTYLYYWFNLPAGSFTPRDYLQVWFDRVAVCDEILNCENITDFSQQGSSTDLVLQMFRSDCQLWSCSRNGTGNGCLGLFDNGYALPPFDFLFEDTRRYVLGGAGLAPGSLTAGDYFIKLLVPNRTRYTLSVYLRSPPATVALPNAVAVRSTIFATAYQHYSYTMADTASSVLASFTVALTEVRCGTLEMFAKHGTVAGPFAPNSDNRLTFIGSSMYNDPGYQSAIPSIPVIGDLDLGTANPSSFEKCASAWCATGDADGCEIVVGTTELFKNLDANGLGTTTWFFSVRGVQNEYDDDNTQLEQAYDDLAVANDDFGIGFLEPTTYFITATAEYYDVSAGQIGCPVAPTDAPFDCSGSVPAAPNAQVTAYGFHTLTRFSSAFVQGVSSVNATTTVQDSTRGFLFEPEYIQFQEPVGTCTPWSLDAGLVYLNDPTLPCFFSQHSGPSLVYQYSPGDAAVQANFVHEPVTLLAPGVVYPARSLQLSTTLANLGYSQYIFYEFSPALTTTPDFDFSFSPSSAACSTGDVVPSFGFDNCQSIDWLFLSSFDLLGLPCSYRPRFLRFDVANSCSADLCPNPAGVCAPISWQLAYRTSVPSNELELGVESCGAYWQLVPLVEQLVGSRDLFAVFELPTVAGSPQQADWLLLDFYPTFADSDIQYYLAYFESASLCDGETGPRHLDSSALSERSQFVCPDWRRMALRISDGADISDSAAQVFADVSIVPSTFSTPITAAGSVSAAAPQLTYTVQSSGVTRFSQSAGFLIYAVDVVASTDELKRSSLSFAVLPSGSDDGTLVQSAGYFADSCNEAYWWVNYASPQPKDCADLPTEYKGCEFAAGTYYVSILAQSIQQSDAFYTPEWRATLVVTLTVSPALTLDVGVSSATVTMAPGETLALEIPFDASTPETLSSGAFALRFSSLVADFASPLSSLFSEGPELPLDSLFGSSSWTHCTDCDEQVFWRTITNSFDVPVSFSVQAQPLSDLFNFMNPVILFPTDAVHQLWMGDLSGVLSGEPEFYTLDLLQPYFEQRAATITPFALGTTLSGSLYNALTYRQVQVYSVQRATPGALAQFRLANVVGGSLAMDVTGAFLPSAVSIDLGGLGLRGPSIPLPDVAFSGCSDLWQCTTVAPFSSGFDSIEQFAPEFFFALNAYNLFEYPLNNWGGSCSIVVDPCDWAASPSWFVVIRDHSIVPYTTSFIASLLTEGPAKRQPESTGLLGFFMPSQDNPFVPTTFDLVIDEQQWAPLSSTPSAVQTFTANPAPSARSADNPRGNAQHFFYAFETAAVSSVRIVVDVSAANALATSGVWVTVTDSDCGCATFERNVWCGADYPGWLCEIEVAVHAEHPGTTTFYVDVYGLKGSFSVAAHSGLDNCVYSDGEAFCPSRLLNYPFWPSLDSSDLDAKASCLYDELVDAFRNVDSNGCASLCADEIDDACQLALRAYACAATFNSCDAAGFLDAHICVDTCTAVEQACPYSFAQIGLTALDCGHPRYSSDVCF